MKKMTDRAILEKLKDMSPDRIASMLAVINLAVAALAERESAGRANFERAYWLIDQAANLISPLDLPH